MNETPASVENFDLGRHAVVEASAGTGKTYTIENLVLRLLLEESVPLEEILIVTFTEKATGDLKTRLRGTLERALQKNEEHTALLKPAVDHFDQAPIFTIHGFCQRLLQEYALEQGQDFRAELVDDIDLLKTGLREIQRKHWRTFFGERLRGVLEKALYSRETAADWEKKVLEIAIRYKPRSGHQLRPPFVQDWWQRLEELDTNWFGQLEIFTVQMLHQHLRDFKRQRGLQSFDDMIATVEESLDREKNSDAENLLDVLRKRYRYGIVDEFQDTDPLQWRIFRRIFLEGGTSKLFVVGDPKQAIFGFRGADLPTYLKAAEEMKTQFAACEYPLRINWRSEPDLLEGLNCLFQDGEWFPRATGIRYLNVHAPDDDKRQTRLEDDRTNRPSLTLVDMTQWDRLKAAQKQFSRFVAHEIQRLLAGNDGQSLLTFSHKNQPARPMHAGDCCVLVMKRQEAEPVMQALELAGIPYSFYKQTGLWQSEEAIHLEVLLQTLARPEDRSAFRKALLTCFFRVKPEELVRAPDVPLRNPARQLYQTWLGYVENRQWSALFRSLLEDTGLLFEQGTLTPGPSPKGRGEKAPMSDRRLTNLRQLLTTLETVGHGFNLDLLGLLDWMRHRRQQRDANEANLQPAELSRPKVKIMTIHASKGLEFPIVFLAGGFTQGQSRGLAAYRDDEGRVVFDLQPGSDSQERVGAEMLSEQRRLLYVALTRPVFKLYVPKVKVSRSSQYNGPVATILLPALEQACPDKLGPLVAEIITPPLAVSVPQARADVSLEPDSAERLPISIAGPLFPTIDANLGKRRIVIRSFSSMTRHHLSHIGEGSSFGDQIQLAEDEVPTALDRDDPLRGAVFGDMVHNVLEKLDFAEAARAATPDDLGKEGTPARKWMDEQIKLNLAKLRTRTLIAELEGMCRRQIAHLVWHSLRTPLRAIGGPLCDIPASDRLPEVEFLFPERSGAPLPADMHWEEGFVTGYMDLLFRKDHKYYLLDWKTNLLPSYSREQIERSMAESDYHRQYQLYLQALVRWLERVHGRSFQFRKHFGGVYYLYVRGLNGRDESTGVYFHQPTEQDLDLKHVLSR